MRGIAISRLMMLAVFVPLAGLAIFGGWLSYDSWSRYSDLSRASSVLRLAVATARFSGLGVPAEGAATREVIGGTGAPPPRAAGPHATRDAYPPRPPPPPAPPSPPPPPPAPPPP